jgi:Protein of unknown function (DUF1580)
MIDVQNEQVLSLTAAAREVPNRDSGRGVNVSTIWRWALKGSRGVRLETAMIGGIRMTSREALVRFYERTTAVANGDSSPAAASKQRQRQIEQAERELAQAGI